MDPKYMPIKKGTLSEKVDRELERVIPEPLDISAEKRVGLAVGWCLTFSVFFWVWIFHVLDQKPKSPYLADATWFLGGGIWVATIIFGFTCGVLLTRKFRNVYFTRAEKEELRKQQEKEARRAGRTEKEAAQMDGEPLSSTELISFEKL